jgi:hypothetical protein
MIVDSSGESDDDKSVTPKPVEDASSTSTTSATSNTSGESANPSAQAQGTATSTFQQGSDVQLPMLQNQSVGIFPFSHPQANQPSLDNINQDMEDDENDFQSREVPGSSGLMMLQGISLPQYSGGSGAGCTTT